MEPPFDISADLDTPVSTYLKLHTLQPRYLLESVEGGVQLARYSFLGFGKVRDFRLDASGMRINGQQYPRPESTERLLAALRKTLADTPRLQPELTELPFSGGLVGISGYDLVRYFEQLGKIPSGAALPDSPEAAYFATESLLIFDHLTRRIALLHSGSEAQRSVLRDSIIGLLRGPLPPRPRSGGYSNPVSSLSEEAFKAAVARSKDYITQG
ncbi:MAG: anthranilate synthase component I, partial [Gammaproteobacteria bacterium]|nr:anthranilate synthase component I [Gammaproteobacteria bacterium]